MWNNIVVVTADYNQICKFGICVIHRLWSTAWILDRCQAQTLEQIIHRLLSCHHCHHQDRQHHQLERFRSSVKKYLYQVFLELFPFVKKVKKWKGFVNDHLWVFSEKRGGGGNVQFRQKNVFYYQKHALVYPSPFCPFLTLHNTKTPISALVGEIFLGSIRQTFRQFF